MVFGVWILSPVCRRQHLGVLFPLESPVPDRGEHRTEGAAFGCQLIRRVLGTVGGVGQFHDRVPPKPFEAFAEDVRGNPLGGGEKFLEALPAEEEVANHQQ